MKHIYEKMTLEIAAEHSINLSRDSYYDRGERAQVAEIMQDRAQIERGELSAWIVSLGKRIQTERHHKFRGLLCGLLGVATSIQADKGWS